MIVCDPVIKEPVLHQLLSRVHRYGQKHEQHVKFLVVRGSFNSLLHDRCVQRLLCCSGCVVVDMRRQAGK